MKFFPKIFLLTGVLLAFSSCFKDLDTIPLDKDEPLSEIVFEDPTSYNRVLAKLYAGLAVSGQQGPAGQADIAGIDEGFGQYLRGYWYMQELTTDEAVIGWNDRTIKNLHGQNWNSDDVFISAIYSRIFFQIVLCNEFLRESTEDKLNSRGQSDLIAEVNKYRLEARFLRALSYWHALDLFRNVPFVTEEDAVGSFFPEQISAADLFSNIESELKAIENELPAPRSNEYGRADRAAAWTLLTKLYLNHKSYLGSEDVKYYTDAITYSKKVIDEGGYSLMQDYQHLFLADNDRPEAQQNIIFSVRYDGVNTQTWGGTTFLVHAPVGGSMNPADFGITGPWSGLRTTASFVDKFPEPSQGNVVTIVAPNPGNQSYPVLQVPGSYQGWDPANTSTVVASQASDNKFEGYFYFPDAGTKFKFTVGTTWDVNYGDTGADGTLDAGGTDITVADAGFYKIEADLTALTYSVQKTDWGLIGNATPGGWDADTGMTYNATSGAWEITVDLVPGKIKFRANDSWDINYGDNGADAIAERNGADIDIAGAGKYVIKLFLDKPDHTYSIERLDPVSADSRSLFHTDGQSKSISDLTLFNDGYAITKWKNVTSTGQAGSNSTHVDTDFPMFRIEDVYLMYAEAVLRGGSGGDLGTALGYINQIRERAYGNSAGNITLNELTLDFILDERARELYWEGHRRTDLVRFGKFSQSTYVWAWKGNVPEGISTSPHLDVFPIPSADLGANPNLNQNPGY